MNIPASSKPIGIITRATAAWRRAVSAALSLQSFGRLYRLTIAVALAASIYWLVIASDRYVSEANVIIQSTDIAGGAAIDLSMLVSGVGGVNRPEQLLLREYLLSVDMLKKLDSELDLRSHYSDWRRDPISRMWFKDESIEWFYRHYLSNVSVVFDDYAGVLRIIAQAYDAKTAQAITTILVREGERYMNELGHQLADVQVAFLTTQVDLAQQRFQQASKALIDFQNLKGLVSPQATAESISGIVAKLEAQRTEIQTQLASLPAGLDRNHPNIVMLKQSLDAVERQIAQERAKLASTGGRTLNYTVEQFHRLQMEVNFTQDLYKTALVALEKGRMDATRTLRKVSVLQTPTLPEYPLQPGRIYNTLVTLLFAGMIAAMLKMLESIVRDHVD